MKKFVILIVILAVMTSLTNSYKEGKLRQHILLRNTPKVVREIEEAIDIMTIKKATNFIKNLPVK